MSVDTIVIIVWNSITIAALAGFLWKWVGVVETKVDDGFGEVTRRLDTQNGRISVLEKWREHRKGYDEGYGRAREKYDMDE